MKLTMSRSQHLTLSIATAVLTLGPAFVNKNLSAQTVIEPVTIAGYQPNQTTPIVVISDPLETSIEQTVAPAEPAAAQQFVVQTRTDQPASPPQVPVRPQQRFEVRRVPAQSGAPQEIEVRVQVEEQKSSSNETPQARRRGGPQNRPEIQTDRPAPPPPTSPPRGGDRRPNGQTSGQQPGRGPQPFGFRGGMAPPGPQGFPGGGMPGGVGGDPNQMELMMRRFLMDQQSPVGEKGLTQQIESLDRVLESSTVQRMLDLMEENLNLKAEMRIHQAEMEARRTVDEVRVAQIMEGAERMQRQAQQQLRENEEIRMQAERAMDEANQMRERAERQRAEAEEGRGRMEEAERMQREAQQQLRESEELRVQADRAMDEANQVRERAERQMAEANEAREMMETRMRDWMAEQRQHEEDMEDEDEDEDEDEEHAEVDERVQNGLELARDQVARLTTERDQLLERIERLAAVARQSGLDSERAKSETTQARDQLEEVVAKYKALASKLEAKGNAARAEASSNEARASADMVKLKEQLQAALDSRDAAKLQTQALEAKLEPCSLNSMQRRSKPRSQRKTNARKMIAVSGAVIETRQPRRRPRKRMVPKNED